jgi:hypothetical protein
VETIRQQPCTFEHTCQLQLCHCQLVAVGWSICSKLVRNTTFFQNTPVALLNFQPRSDPLGLSVELQVHVYNIQLLDNKSLFQSLLSPHKVWAWSFPALCIRIKKEKTMQHCMVLCSF